MKRLILLGTPLLLLLAACSSKVVKKDELAQVKRAAVIGLDVQQQKAISGGDLASLALKTASKPQAVPSVRVESSHIDPIYKALNAKIAERSGWKMTSLRDLTANAAYQRVFNERTKGFHNRPMLNDRFVCFAPTKVMDGWAAQTADKTDLIALAKALKVDALVIATSTVELNNNSVFASMVGAGKFRPSSNIMLTVYDGRTGEKIYFEQAQGPQVEEAAKNTLGMTDQGNLNRLAQNASSLSIDMVVQDL